MVRIAKRTLKGKTYYYLEHTVRNRDKRTTKSKYLGNKLPKNSDEMSREFLFELDKTKWFDEFEKIRSHYNIEVEQAPSSARRKALHEFSVRFTFDTQKIEGSTLTLRETARLLDDRVSPSGKPIEDAKEAEAHHKVFLEMLDLKSDLSQQLVQEWHWKIFRETKPDIAGQIRKQGVRISGSRYIPPTPVELQPLLREFFSWYNRVKTKINPVELAGLVKLRFVTIHPFTDGNGRISRLMMNFVLHRNKHPMLNIEYRRRGSYYGALERSQLSRNDRPFMNWFFRRYLREFNAYLN